LQLLDSRFAADQVLALLDSPALLQRFGLQAEDLPFIQDWVRQSGIRWGRDAAHKAALGLPADPLFTWRWGLDRLLLGSILPPAMAGDDSGLFADLLPQGGAGGQLAEVLARFANCYAVLDELAVSWATPANAADWALRLLEGMTGCLPWMTKAKPRWGGARCPAGTGGRCRHGGFHPGLQPAGIARLAATQAHHGLAAGLFVRRRHLLRHGADAFHPLQGVVPDRHE
jgi:hypothetical protein